MGRLIGVSNRTAADPNARAGGLAVALWDALVASNGTWFGWSGRTVDEARGIEMFSDGGVDFALVDLTHEEHERFYLGYSNRALWPIFHYRTDLANFDDEDFAGYEAVNHRFARLLSKQLKPDDVVWVHDYHFCLMGEELRQHGFDGRIGYFLHIPFPAPEVFRTLPEHTRLARAMTAYNLLGFQTEDHKANFERYLLEFAGGRKNDDGTVSVHGRTVTLKAYPIGIDVDDFAALAEKDKAREASTRIGRFLGGRELVLGVDRMDYSKGLPQRFEAVGRLIRDYPDLHGKVSYTQIAPPSRTKVDEYAELREQLDQLSGSINGDHGDLDWIPIRYLARSYTRDELAGLYRIARVGLVTPLRDGMNLVAKEFIAAQDPHDPGVLVLSHFAGAASQMPEALLVNPYDTHEVADAIYRAIHMPLEERKERWSAIDKTIREKDIYWWRQTFLHDLGHIDAESDLPPVELNGAA
ncbi:alpha,alpha-trehalose-phosphate synthase (UDP-forming) [Aquisalinus flavus]|uniref:Trehalose-6-phosphate synthase n=1 Tax=Aquisalinus flavus TaxID=1526572 RepID=A0A8J2V5R9_9PROT|nr:trehalose-6-phosphate synthase [Aquisalinus flavus]MBD0426889.1 trehalose-6-phosphate synthase [Aquisalinus flavus]UNE46734.1 trehalose-6-phosphate synthase [Aquisalinus flavus]GGC96757.1 trehalose-6-phosphate synthase [Aquisalinus flavus]